ncbi:DUF2735 domain-containing protein [Jiella sp. M17.18]|uniref:DUF2735 domain-containing protein n=1 Tax=Jiella sp. M17.18 TaxID=3234247 RepID=UPI0034DFEF61
MRETTSHPSATIIPFPVRRREPRQESRSPRYAEIQPAVRKPVILDGCWYHEEALREADRTRKS